MSVSMAVLIIAVFFQLTGWAYTSSIIPQTGPLAVNQLSLDATANLTVLSISPEPGAEDLAALVYLRLGRGAKVVSVYITNGEGDILPERSAYPLEIAVQKRATAAKAMQELGIEPVFLNFPDITSASDTAIVNQKWDRGSLQYALMELISRHQPDAVLVSPSITSIPQYVRNILLTDLRQSLRYIGRPKTDDDFRGEIVFTRWDVERVLIPSDGEPGVGMPVDRIHPILGISYEQIASSVYPDAGRETTGRTTVQKYLYRGLRETDTAFIQDPLIDMPSELPVRLENIAGFMKETLMPFARGGSVDDKERLLNRVVVIIDSLDQRLRYGHPFRGNEYGLLVRWKQIIEELRAVLIGAELHFSLSETILSDRQLTYLSIDSIAGVANPANAEIFFPLVEQGWFVNESLHRSFPLDMEEEYRVVTPQSLTYNYPPLLYGYDKQAYAEEFLFYLIYRGDRKEESFIRRYSTSIFFTPRFTVEPLNGIVRAVEFDPVLVRLTNHSRDGIADHVRIRSPYGMSDRKFFRLDRKGASATEDLYVKWGENLPEGDYLLPVMIGADTVAMTAARSFSVDTAEDARIAIIARDADAAVVQAVKRIGTQPELLKPLNLSPATLESKTVVLIDRTGMPDADESIEQASLLAGYVRTGGNLIILSQDAAAWNENPIIEGFELERWREYDEHQPMIYDSRDPVFSVPNRIVGETWDNWIFSRAPNKLHLDPNAGFDIIAANEIDGTPFIVGTKLGEGRVLYLNLSLEHQLMNVHPGVHRLLANIVSLSARRDGP